MSEVTSSVAFARAAEHNLTAAMLLPVWPVAAVGCLTLLAVAIAMHAWLKGRGARLSLRSATSHLLGFVWLLPVAAVLLLVASPVLYNHRSANRVETAHTTVELPANAVATAHVAVEHPAAAAMFETASGSVGATSIQLDEESAERPDWVDAGEVNRGDRRMLVVAGGQFPVPEQARRSALDAAVEAVRQEVSLPGNWTLPPDLVQHDAVRQTYIEPITRSTGVNDFVVYRAYHQLELTNQVRDAVKASWRNQTVSGRLWIIGGLLGFVVLSLGTAATYLRLDAITAGKYRRRLKLASVSLLVAGGLALSKLLPMA